LSTLRESAFGVLEFAINNYMPRLSLYHPIKSNDYRFFDKTISQMFTAGATDLYVHKYLGPTNQGASIDYTQPEYAELNPTNIQDLLFLENRDRTYDPNIYRLRGHYNVQNLDFDLSQFGLFLNNDIIFITVHYNDMIDLVGRKLMVGDVIELPHLLDYNPLKETIPVALKRFYQITDGNFASEGFSPTWYPHLWRIKCEPLVDSQEFSQILNEPINQDNYLGLWDKDKTYPAGYVISYGDKNYISKIEVPIGIAPPNNTYWELDTAQDLKDILSTYNKNIDINNANLEEAKRNLPKAGYDRSQLYIVPTYGEYSENGVTSGKNNQPAPPVNVNTNASGAPITVTGTVAMMRNPKYKNASPVIRIPKNAVKSIWDMTADTDFGADPIDAFVQMSLESLELAPEAIGNGSGPLQGDRILVAQSLGVITGPYGTADNTYATADQNPELPGFTGTVSTQMDFRADCDPAYQYIARSSPRSFGYTTGYLSGDGQAPNGFPTGAGISFPQNPQVGDYFLRTDYFPQLLYRWDGKLWIRISTNVRTETSFNATNTSQLSGFINNEHQTVLTSGTTVPQSQPLSSILQLTPDAIPPRTNL
jgi:hypothetical protein